MPQLGMKGKRGSNFSFQKNDSSQRDKRRCLIEPQLAYLLVYSGSLQSARPHSPVEG